MVIYANSVNENGVRIYPKVNVGDSYINGYLVKKNGSKKYIGANKFVLENGTALRNGDKYLGNGKLEERSGTIITTLSAKGGKSRRSRRFRKSRRSRRSRRSYKK